jgi:hypothetical protein
MLRDRHECESSSYVLLGATSRALDPSPPDFPRLSGAWPSTDRWLQRRSGAIWSTGYRAACRIAKLLVAGNGQSFAG